MAALARDTARMKREGLAAMTAGRWPQAAALLREYLELHPGDGRIWTSLATSLESSGDTGGALEALRSAATAYERDQFFVQAAASWVKASRLAPEDGFVVMRAGDMYRALGLRGDARKQYERAEGIYRQAGRSYEQRQARNRIEQLESQGPEPAGVPAPAESVAAEPGPAETGRAETGRAETGRAVEMPPDAILADEAEVFVEDRLSQAALMRRFALFSYAVRALDDVLARFPEHRAASELLVQVLRDAGDHDRASALQRQLDAASPIVGRIEPPPERHVPQCECVGDTEPESDPIIDEAGIVVEEEESLVAEEGAVAGMWEPSTPPGEVGLAESPKDEPVDPAVSGRDPEWERLFVKQESRQTREVDTFAELLDSLEPVDECHEAFVCPVGPSGEVLTPAVRQQIVRITAEADDRTRLDLAMAFISMGLEEEAVAELQEVAKGSEMRFEASLELAEVFVRRSLPQAALRWYERALGTPGRSFEEDHRVRYRLGLACEATGDIVRAFDLYLDLFAEDARFEDVADRVRRLKPLLGS